MDTAKNDALVTVTTFLLLPGVGRYGSGVAVRRSPLKPFLRQRRVASQWRRRAREKIQPLLSPGPRRVRERKKEEAVASAAGRSQYGTSAEFSSQGEFLGRCR